MNNPQYTQEQAQLLYDTLVHHNASTLESTFDAEERRELDAALATLRMELSLFIADGYKGETEEDEMLDDDLHQQDWLDGQ
ncbi:MAG: hypothetical protein PHF31_11560 [Methylobacter sp.]|nr:hypothetical protein [Methylobacter sp.]